MSFIDEFLDISASLPREIIRRAKLLKEVDEKSSEKRRNYIAKLKSKTDKTDLTELFNTIDIQYQEALALGEYKGDIIKELNYILFDHYKKKLDTIIENGEKEVMNSGQANGIIPATNSFLNDKSFDDSITCGSKAGKKSGDLYAGKTAKEGKLCGKKKNRPQKNKNKKGFEYIDPPTLPISQTTIGNQTGNEIEVYCICHAGSYGEMIKCDNQKCHGQWFHYDCVGITEVLDETKAWYCSPECESQACQKEDKTYSKKKKKK